MVPLFDRHDLSARAAPSIQAALSKSLRLVTWAILFGFFVNLLMLTGPLYMLQLYDRVLLSGSIETLVALSILAGLSYVLMALFDLVRQRILARAGAQLQAALERRLYDLAPSGPSHIRATCLDRSALRSLEDVQAFLSSPALLNATDLLWAPIFIGLIFYFHPVLGSVSVIAVVSVMALSWSRQFASDRRFKGVRLKLAQSRPFGDGAFGDQEFVAGPGMRPALARRWLALRWDALNQSVEALDRTASFSALIKSYRQALQSVMLGVGGYLALKSEVTTGTIFASSILLGRGLLPAEQLMNSWPVWGRGREGWRALRQLDETYEPAEITFTPEDDAEALLVSRADIMAPGGAAPLVRSISFHLSAGKALGVVGPTGAGKSALASALVGAWRPSSGEIRLGGNRLDRLPAERLGKIIGYLPQDIYLCPGSIAENIARMAADPDPGAVVRAARAAGAHDLIMGLPEGYQTLLDTTAAKLSAGQRQRIGLARALYGEPRLLVLDEPSSALDSAGLEAMSRAVRRFKRNGGMVVIMSQQPNAIKECDSLLVLQNGAAAEFTSRHDLLEKLMASGRRGDFPVDQVGASQ